MYVCEQSWIECKIRFGSWGETRESNPSRALTLLYYLRTGLLLFAKAVDVQLSPKGIKIPVEKVFGQYLTHVGTAFLMNEESGTIPGPVDQVGSG